MPALSSPVSAAAVRDRTGRHPHHVLIEHKTLRLLGEAERQALLRWSVLRSVPRQEVVFRRGDPARSVVVVVDGFLKLCTSCDDREVVLDILGRGGSAGEIAVLNRWPLQADAVALTGCRILAIDGRQFLRVLEHSPAAQAAVMRLVSERLQGAIEQVTEALGLSGPGRLARALLRLASLSSAEPRDRLRVSQSDLGAMAGITRESVNKCLSSWREAGWVKIAGGTIDSVNTVALQQLLHEGAAPSKW